MRSVGVALGAPLLCTIWRPATCPCRPLMTLVTCFFSSASLLMTEAEPVNEERFCSPKATTNTSSNCSESACRVTVICGFTATSVFFIPTNEMTSTSVFFRLAKLNFPSRLVICPFWVSFTTTEAPISGSHASSVTTPCTLMVCANSVGETQRRRVRKRPSSFSFIISSF